jgi:hypothetical protein
MAALAPPARVFATIPPGVAPGPFKGLVFTPVSEPSGAQVFQRDWQVRLPGDTEWPAMRRDSNSAEAKRAPRDMVPPMVAECRFIGTEFCGLESHGPAALLPYITSFLRFSAHVFLCDFSGTAPRFLASLLSPPDHLASDVAVAAFAFTQAEFADALGLTTRHVPDKWHWVVITTPPDVTPLFATPWGASIVGRGETVQPYHVPLGLTRDFYRAVVPTDDNPPVVAMRAPRLAEDADLVSMVATRAADDILRGPRGRAHLTAIVRTHAHVDGHAPSERALVVTRPELAAMERCFAAVVAGRTERPSSLDGVEFHSHALVLNHTPAGAPVVRLGVQLRSHYMATHDRIERRNAVEQAHCLSAITSIAETRVFVLDPDGATHLWCPQYTTVTPRSRYAFQRILHSRAPVALVMSADPTAHNFLAAARLTIRPRLSLEDAISELGDPRQAPALDARVAPLEQPFRLDGTPAFLPGSMCIALSKVARGLAWVFYCLGDPCGKCGAAMCDHWEEGPSLDRLRRAVPDLFFAVKHAAPLPVDLVALEFVRHLPPIAPWQPGDGMPYSVDEKSQQRLDAIRRVLERALVAPDADSLFRDDQWRRAVNTAVHFGGDVAELDHLTHAMTAPRAAWYPSYLCPDPTSDSVAAPDNYYPPPEYTPRLAPSASRSAPLPLPSSAASSSSSSSPAPLPLPSSSSSTASSSSSTRRVREAEPEAPPPPKRHTGRARQSS